MTLNHKNVSLPPYLHNRSHEGKNSFDEKDRLTMGRKRYCFRFTDWRLNWRLGIKFVLLKRILQRIQVCLGQEMEDWCGFETRRDARQTTMRNETFQHLVHTWQVIITSRFICDLGNHASGTLVLIIRASSRQELLNVKHAMQSYLYRCWYSPSQTSRREGCWASWPTCQPRQ